LGARWFNDALIRQETTVVLLENLDFDNLGIREYGIDESRSPNHLQPDLVRRAGRERIV
jgi:hypothetical protein